MKAHIVISTLAVGIADAMPLIARDISSPFPDGQLSCSTFPSDYGAVRVDWVRSNGWSGIQLPGGISNGQFTNIRTVTSCTDGAYCSYACPAGYQKSQWPSTQGNSGQSVGGLECRSGRLFRSNPAFPTICTRGTTAVTVNVRNQGDFNAAICRTDYPGTEQPTIPLSSTAGSTVQLTVPDSATYFQWNGMPTSAQYYLNPRGSTTSQSCTTGGESQSPVVVGAVFQNGVAFVSIAQNSPTNTQQLDYSVEITGSSGTCRYSAGQYCSSESCNTNGCTVSISNGRTATLTLSS